MVGLYYIKEKITNFIIIKYYHKKNKIYMKECYKKSLDVAI